MKCIFEIFREIIMQKQILNYYIQKISTSVQYSALTQNRNRAHFLHPVSKIRNLSWKKNPHIISSFRSVIYLFKTEKKRMCRDIFFTFIDISSLSVLENWYFWGRVVEKVIRLELRFFTHGRNLKKKCVELVWATHLIFENE